MRRAGWLAALAVLLAGDAAAAGPFDGVWVDDLQSQAGTDYTDVYLVAHGAYRCDSCTPPRAYPADGRPHAVPGDPDTISESVRIAGPRSIVTTTVSRAMTRETTMTVSADGQTATYVALDRWPQLRAPLRTRYEARRTAPAAPGAHPVSGSWKGLGYQEVPEPYRSIELTETDGSLTRISFRRGRYTAAYGGPPAPLEGVPGDYGAQVARPDERTRVETILKGGKPVTERTYRLSADGQSLETSVKDLASGKVFRITSHRKPGRPAEAPPR